jgi:hypothetical protein
MTRADDALLTEREAAVLGPLAEHRLLIVPQVAALLGLSARTAVSRLKALERADLVWFGPIFQGLPWAASIESHGLRALGSRLKPPQLNLNEYSHDVGVGWLWLAARAGRLGDLRGLTTERRMQSDDAGRVAAGQESRWGVGLGLLGSHGHPKRHYPDLMLDMASGHRVAVELELTAKSAGRVDRIMTAYASDARVDHVLYLAADGSIPARLREAAHHAGIPERVHVQRLAPDGIAGADLGRTRRTGRGHAAERARVARRARPPQRGAER